MIDFAFLTPAERRTPGVLNGYLPTTFRLDRGRPRYQYLFLAASLPRINGRYRHHQSPLRISFWGLEHCMPHSGSAPTCPWPASLCSALVPEHHEVMLIDENVEDIDFDRLGRADLVCLTGMSIQGRR